MEKVNWLNEKLLQKTFVFWHGRAMKSLGKLNRAFLFLPPPKIVEFLSTGPEGGIFKPWQEFYFVALTLKSHANLGITLNAALLISLPKIGQFLLTEWKGSNFEILLLSFVWKENWLNQKTITGVLFCDTEKPGKLWDNTECCFPSKPLKSWSISFDWAKRVQSWTKNFYKKLSFSDTEGPWKVWVNWIVLSYFSLPQKLLNFFPLGQRVEYSNLDRSFILWHWH